MEISRAICIQNFRQSKALVA